MVKKKNEGKLLMADILKLENINKTYQCSDKVVNALQDVSLEIERGEMVAIMGSSGSGKSTLLHIMGAIDKPDSGKIYLNHVYEKDYSIEPKATKNRRDYMGFIYQNYNLLEDFTVEENISLPLILSNHTNKTIKKLCKEKIELVGLNGRETHRPSELSGGQQQRVAIARALITNPKILLADEPTGNLDYKTTTDIMELICKLSKELNQTTVIVTHDPNVATYVDRVVFFSDGKITGEHRNRHDESDLDNILDRFRNVIN
ncbi:ABC transporter ATP-binding protein [Anaerosporobacter sp.]|uniref:ABC transporter ATP-binding protein n=1 Tax=Anaerosporobacter sp. TaxID=1872529 RepID=UPI00286F93EC|nr:ABC transporter ATP-binding protein [Anaerosporobacter sp.]